MLVKYRGGEGERAFSITKSKGITNIKKIARD